MTFTIVLAVSYQEFLQAFRTKTIANTVEFNRQDSSILDGSSENLLGLDAKIPGGKYDSNRSK